jgi:hypothetical protein
MSVTDAPEPAEERFRLYRLCECDACDGTGKDPDPLEGRSSLRCSDCRGEGRIRELVATATDPQSVGVALVTLGREGEWDECPIGCLDTMGEPGKRWILKPWLPSARNVSDAGRTLRRARG